MKWNVKSRDWHLKESTHVHCIVLLSKVGVSEKWNGKDWGFFLGGGYETRSFCEAGSGRMGSESWKHSFVWPNQERIKQKTLNHPVYLRMCVMQKMPFTAWTESGCVAGRLKSSLPRATEKVSVRLTKVSPNVVNKGLRFIHSFIYTAKCGKRAWIGDRKSVV